MAAAAAVASLCSLQHAVLLCEGKCRGTREGSERYDDDTPLLLSFSHVALSSVEIRTPKESDVHDRFLYSKGEYNCKNIHLNIGGSTVHFLLCANLCIDFCGRCEIYLEPFDCTACP